MNPDVHLCRIKETLVASLSSSLYNVIATLQVVHTKQHTTRTLLPTVASHKAYLTCCMPACLIRYRTSANGLI